MKRSEFEKIIEQCIVKTLRRELPRLLKELNYTTKKPENISLMDRIRYDDDNGLFDESELKEKAIQAFSGNNPISKVLRETAININNNNDEIPMTNENRGIPIGEMNYRNFLKKMDIKAKSFRQEGGIPVARHKASKTAFESKNSSYKFEEDKK